MRTKEGHFQIEWWVIQKRAIYFAVLVGISCVLLAGAWLYVSKYGNPLRNVAMRTDLPPGARFIDQRQQGQEIGKITAGQVLVEACQATMHFLPAPEIRQIHGHRDENPPQAQSPKDEVKRIVPASVEAQGDTGKQKEMDHIVHDDVEFGAKLRLLKGQAGNFSITAVDNGGEQEEQASQHLQHQRWLRQEERATEAHCSG